MLGQRWKSVPLNTVITMIYKPLNNVITITKAHAINRQLLISVSNPVTKLWTFWIRLCWAENVVAVEVAFLAAWVGFRCVRINIACFSVVQVWTQALFFSVCIYDRSGLRRPFAFKRPKLWKKMTNIQNEELDRNSPSDGRPAHSWNRIKWWKSCCQHCQYKPANCSLW